MSRTITTLSLFAATALFSTGCSSYVNSPRMEAARKAKVQAFSHPLIARAYKANPEIRFPATIGIATMDHAAQTQLRAMDAENKLDSLKSLPQVRATVNVNSLVLASGDPEMAGPDGKPAPVWNKADLVIREAAARLGTDVVLLLKIETSVTDGKLFAPLTLATLGMFPNNRTEVIATALAALVDTRTGYVYATAERSAGKTCHTISWDDFTRDRTQHRAEQQAMQKLFSEFPAIWAGVVAKHRR